ILLGPMAQTACWVPLSRSLVGICRHLFTVQCRQLPTTGFAKRCQMTRDRAAGASFEDRCHEQRMIISDDSVSISVLFRIKLLAASNNTAKSLIIRPRNLVGHIVCRVNRVLRSER